MAEILRLTEDVRLPLPDTDGKVDRAYIRELVGELETIINDKIYVTTNLILDQVGNIGTWYSGIPDESGVYPDGTWRITENEAGELAIEKKVASVWTLTGRYNV